MRLVLSAALLAASLVAFAAGEVKVGTEQIQALGIETIVLSSRATARIEGLPAQVVVPGAQLHVVSAPLAALVERVLVSPHQPVKKGQVLARLQSPALAELQHTFLQAATQASLARATLEREEKLYADGIIAQSRLLASRSHFVEVSADLAERTQALRLAGMSEPAIGRLRSGQRVGTSIELVSPLDGVVLEQMAVAGERVEAAAAVLKVARLDPLWLEIQLPLARLDEVRDGAEVTVPGLDAAGVVIAVGRSVASANQTVLVRARIERGAARLRPGQYVEAAVASTGEGMRWSVPAQALARVAGEPVVFVRSAEGFRAQPVKVLSESSGQGVIAGELKGDERIAVKGVAALKAALAGIGPE